MVHAKDVETQKFGTQFQNIKGCHERLRANGDDLVKELEKDKHDWKKPFHEQDLKSLATLTLRRPNPCCIPTLDATIVSCHLFEVFFSTATIKSVFSKPLFVLCASLSLSYPTPNPWTQ